MPLNRLFFIAFVTCWAFFILTIHFQFSTVLILFFCVSKKALADIQALLRFLAFVLAGAKCETFTNTINN